MLAIAAMTEIANHAGNEPWPSLEVASKWFDRASIVLALSLLVGFAATATIVWLGIVKEHHWDGLRDRSNEKVAALELETANAKAALGIAQADIAKANEKVAEANERTEKLRAENLELEAAVAPRILELWAPSQALKKYAGMRVVISFAPEFDSQRLASHLFEMFKMAEWSPEFLFTDRGVGEAVTVEWQGGIKLGSDNHPETFEWNLRGEEAAKALEGELKKQNIETKTFRFPPPREGFPERRPGVPPEAVSVKVGVKSNQYFLEKKFPEMKAMRERVQQQIDEANRRADEMIEARRRQLVDPNK
jgi:hypothetical protein